MANVLNIKSKCEFTPSKFGIRLSTERRLIAMRSSAEVVRSAEGRGEEEDEKEDEDEDDEGAEDDDDEEAEDNDGKKEEGADDGEEKGGNVGER